LPLLNGDAAFSYMLAGRGPRNFYKISRTVRHFPANPVAMRRDRFARRIQDRWAAKNKKLCRF
jgi:hypothetical protein